MRTYNYKQKQEMFIHRNFQIQFGIYDKLKKKFLIVALV